MVKVEFQVSGETINYSTNGFETAREPFGKRKKIESLSHAYLKINARQINVLNMKNKIPEELEKITGVSKYIILAKSSIRREL